MSERDDAVQHLAPLPWSTGSYGICDANRRVVISLSLRLADKQTDANKRLLEMVVRAVNAHDELFESLYLTASMLNAFVREDSDAIAAPVLQQARAALAKARG